jgi:hypothetical protein
MPRTGLRSRYKTAAAICSGNSTRSRPAIAKLIAFENLQQVVTIGLDAKERGRFERIDELAARRLAIRCVADDLREQRVVVDGDFGPRLERRVDPHVFRRVPGVHNSGGRQEAAGRVLGIQPRFDRMTEHPGMRREALALGHFDLKPDQVDAGHEFGHRMLHLNARVDLDKVEVAGRRQQKLDGSGVGVADGATQRDRCVAHAPAQVVIERGRRTFLNDLLMAALHRAVALEQVDQVAVMIGENLKLDVPRAFDIALDEQRAVAEGAFRFATGCIQRFGKLAARGNDAHAAPAAARRGLDEYGEFEIRSRIECRDDGHAG